MSTANSVGAQPLNIQDYFSSVKDGSWKQSVTDDGKLASAVAKKSNDSLNKDDFMHLLVTQLQYQDPTAPADNQQMAAQLAQYSALEAMQAIQKGVDGLGNTVSGAANAQTSAANVSSGAAAASLLGRPVVMRQSEVTIVGDVALSMAVHGSATDTLVFKNDKGEVVKSISLSGANADGSPVLGADGSGTVQDTPTDDENKPLQGHFSVDVVDAAGNSHGYAYGKGSVSGLEFRDGAPYLTIGGNSFKMSDLLAVSASDASNF